MAIATLADYAAAAKQSVQFTKTSAHTTAAAWFTLWDATGIPTGATFAVGNTANGVVPTDATTGAPTVNFGTGNGHITLAEYTVAATCKVLVYDRLFHCGAYAFNAATSLASQPSFSSRVPSGTDYSGLQIWVEAVTTFTGAPSIEVTYTDQSGNTGATTGAISLASGFAIGRLAQLPLAAGDSGLSKIESVTATVASAGTFNVFVARPLCMARLDFANISRVDPLEVLGMPQIFGDSCLALMFEPDAAGSPVTDVMLEIASY